MSRLISALAARSQATKPCSDGVSRLLVVEREIEEFVERVVGFGAEPRQNGLARRLRRRAVAHRTRTAMTCAPAAPQCVEPRRDCRNRDSRCFARSAARSDPVRARRQARTIRPRSGRTAGSSARWRAPDRPPAAAAHRRAPSGPSPRYARSAPAGRRRRPECRAFFSARMIASNSAPRWRTRISMSPGAHGRRSPSPPASPRAIHVRSPWRSAAPAHARACLRRACRTARPSLDLALLVRLFQRPDFDQAGRRVAHRAVHGAVLGSADSPR